MISNHKGVVCEPIDDTFKIFHFTFMGQKDSDYDGGIYHGEIQLPSNYPLGPPTIQFLSENGRF